jgi:cobalt-zinc-cadmium efflux system protein
MLLVAVAGLLANAICAWVLARGGGHAHNLNTRGAFLHVVGDLLGSVAAIVAALVMLSTGWYLVDPILSAVIGGLILWSSWKLLRESVDVLLEAAPPEMAMADVRDDLTGVAGVVGVHDMHVWAVTSGFVAISAHVEVDESRPWEAVLIDLDSRAREAWGIVHVTFQPESAGATAAVFRGCSLDSPKGREACRLVPAGAHRDPVAAS